MQQDVAVGVFAAIVSAITYGSTYVPVRWFEAGDGFYFQWLMCLGQTLFGVVVLAIAGWPPIFPLAMLSGAFFATGNALTVYIMDGVGMAVGSLLWNTITCVVGWAVTRFGLFWNPVQLPHNQIMNAVGVVVVCVGGCFFATIKHYPMEVRPAPWQPRKERRLSFEETKRPSNFRRITAILLTFLVGSLYGNMLTPINYLVLHSTETGNPSNVSAYFFSFCVGALLTSTIIFMIYSTAKKNRPFVNPELTLPSLTSGIIYAVATYGFFLANQHLDQTIAYPILSKSPGIVVSLWAVFLFHEIKGVRDLTTLVVGIITTIVGIVLISISKINFQ
ncbi:unnamed protein product [Cylicocyclus nassatus]|uniref:Transmembrane protein 144 n=1 Tax=Cylicocyclus nassatus TaxID=53992 RepID=A0AA36MA35_CYLNA|nr:unnamed protein product [Cylicocyclus nassatus]